MRPVVFRAGARRARRLLLLLASFMFAAVPAGSALAGTTIGETGGGVTCKGAPRGVVYVDLSYVVPSAGTITSFSFASDSSNKGNELDFLVLHRLGDSVSYTVVGKTGLVTLKGTGLETFSTRIAVDGPDQGQAYLGLWTPGVLNSCAHRGGDTIFGGVEAADPSTGATIDVPNGGPLEDLNESANLVTLGKGPLSTSKAQCKHGGWRAFGSMFKNQGDCTSFVATRGKNPPSGS